GLVRGQLREELGRGYVRAGAREVEAPDVAVQVAAIDLGDGAVRAVRRVGRDLRESRGRIVASRPGRDLLQQRAGLDVHDVEPALAAAIRAVRSDVVVARGEQGDPAPLLRLDDLGRAEGVAHRRVPELPEDLAGDAGFRVERARVRHVDREVAAAALAESADQDGAPVAARLGRAVGAGEVRIKDPGGRVDVVAVDVVLLRQVGEHAGARAGRPRVEEG